MNKIPSDIALDSSLLPKHIAIIMDGNGRWAKEQGKERAFGHKEGVSSVKNIIRCCNDLNIPYLTLYAFSSENWNRPQMEVSFLMSLLSETIAKETEELNENGIRLNFIGEVNNLPKAVLEEINKAMEFTKHNEKGVLTIALSYGSQKEIVRAAKKISQAVQSGELKAEDINEAIFEKHLYTHDLPNVDLLIRTSGEFRISNFLLWQIAYAELYFTNVLWPDFDREHLFDAIRDYQKRERRFGKTSEQIKF